MKKIGILTLGLKDNYGGILQCICLYSYLKSQGYDPVLIRKYPKEKGLRKFLIKVLEILPFQNIKGLRLIRKKYTNNLKFWSNYIDKQSPIFFNKREISKFINNENIDTLIVGSDQVWRYKYINDGQYDTYFLNFDISSKLKKISYAASFGSDNWEKASLNEEISEYLADFKAVSVRESQGLDICSNDFKYNKAELVLDPTLLIDREFYEDMIKNTNMEKFECLEYILDKNEYKSKVAEKIKAKHNLEKTLNLLDKGRIYSIAEWVSAFKNTNFVITDSFHGMVFSIIFNKQFVVLVNEGRGSSRFESLCSILNIKDRLILRGKEYNSKLPDINYGNINTKINQLRIKSAGFLKSNIES